MVKEKKLRFVKIKAFYEKVFESPKKTILYTGALLGALLLLYFLYIFFVNKNFYNNWTDDVLQYYPIMCDFISDIKAGNFSFFNYKNYLGASIFSDAYYVPLDGFTVIIFLLSFVMETEVAMSVVELVKIVCGVMALCWYLSLKKVDTKIIHLIGILYFASSGITCFSAFPCFTSLAFYLPFSLVIGYYFMKGKWYFVPAFAFLCVLYNFYLAYTIFAFMAFSILFMLILEKKSFFKVVFGTIKYVVLIVLGLVIGMAIFMPSCYFILNSTTRDIVDGGSSINRLMVMFASYIDCIYTAFSCCFTLIKNVFTSRGGIFRNSTIVSDSFLQLKYLYRILSSRRVVDGDTLFASFFDIEEFYRMLNNAFVPSDATDFYGYQSSYLLEHFSFYITNFGLLISTYIWFLKDYKSKVYKAMLILIYIMMALPFFSYILSANLEVLYTRWFSIVTIPLLLIDAHIIKEKESIFNLEKKGLVTSGAFLFYFGLISSYHHFYKINFYANKYNWSDELIAFEKEMFYIALAVVAISVVLLISLYLIQTKTKHKKIFTAISASLLGSAILLLGIKLLLSYLGLSDGIFSTEKTGGYFSFDGMLLSQYLTLFSLVLIATYILLIVLKKKKIILVLVCLEFMISGIYSYAVNVSLSGKVTTYNNCHDVSDFIQDNIDNGNIEEPDIYRIYIDSSIEGLITRNTARLMPVGTNQTIFHSFINSATDDFVDIIFNVSGEGQAKKAKLNTYSYFLNILLGYRYIVASPNSVFVSYSDNYFTIVSETDEYVLLEFNNYQEFLNYTKYCTIDEYDSVKSSLKETSRMKFIIDEAVINGEFSDLVKSYLGESSGTSSAEMVTSTTYYQRRTISGVFDDTGDFYVYSFKDDEEVTTRSSAINLFYLSAYAQSLVENNQIYVVYDDGSKFYLTSNNIKSMNGSTFHIACYSKKIEYIYIHKYNESSSTVPKLDYTAEAVFPSTDLIDDYENNRPITDLSGTITDKYSIFAYLKFHIGGLYSGSLINISIDSDYDFTKMVVEYTDGTFAVAPTEFTPSKDILNIYVSKSEDADISSKPSPFSLKIVEETIEDYDNTLINKDVETKGSKIIVTYDNSLVEDGYSVIMLSVPYSEEWKLVKGNVKEIISVNGGFIGLIVPTDIKSNEIIIKFEPYGLNNGLILSIFGILTYVFMVIEWYYNKRRKEKKQCKL